jgi:hypothetical protein
VTLFALWVFVRIVDVLAARVKIWASVWGGLEM